MIDLDDLENDDNMFAEESKQPTGDSSSMIRRVRKYDLSITYDFYTQTPRLWLTGYSEDGAPLTQKEIFEDIAADYAKKTVTMDILFFPFRLHYDLKTYFVSCFLNLSLRVLF